MTSKQDPPVKKNAFVHKLYGMLNNPKLAHLIWWTGKEDSNTFALYPSKEFADALLDYFKHGNVASFVRQLHMYGFHKILDPLLAYHDKDLPVWEFRHLLGKFRKNDELLLVYIKRRSSSNLRNSLLVEGSEPLLFDAGGPPAMSAAAAAAAASSSNPVHQYYNRPSYHYYYAVPGQWPQANHPNHPATLAQHHPQQHPPTQPQHPQHILSILSILRRTSWALCIPSIFSISSTSRLSICTSTFNTSPSKCRFRTSNRPARSRSRLIIYCSSTVLCSRLPRPRTTKSSRQLLTCRLLGNSPTLRRPGRRCSQRTLPQQTTSSAHLRQRQLHSSENPGSWRQRLSRDLGTRRSCSIHWPPMLITETQKRSSYRLWCPEISLVQRSGSTLPLQLRPPHQLRQQYQLPQQPQQPLRLLHRPPPPPAPFLLLPHRCLLFPFANLSTISYVRCS